MIYKSIYVCDYFKCILEILSNKAFFILLNISKLNYRQYIMSKCSCTSHIVCVFILKLIAV